MLLENEKTNFLIFNFKTVMARKPNTVGGGSNTNLNGLAFEGRTDLREAIEKHPDYSIEENLVYKNDEVVAYYFEKYGLYKKLLKPRGINYKEYLSKRLLPDGALLVEDTLFIIEKKYQASSGSVDEKLQTCDFKRKQYQRLLEPLNIHVEYYFILNDWFDQPMYDDVFNYIESVGCKYFINKIPLSELNL